MSRAKRLVRSGLARMGLELRRIEPNESARVPDVRKTFAEALAQIAGTGFEPNTVIDVGVAYGTPELYEAFPSSRLILVEAIREWEPVLKQLQAERGAEYIIAAAGAHSGTVEITVPNVLAWASVDTPESLAWATEAAQGGTTAPKRTVPVVVLDDVAIDLGLPPPYVLKIDVEGAEPSVLQGSRELLAQCEVVALEVTLDANYWSINDILEEHGFVLHDVYGQHYRPSDGALIQIDLMFVKAGGRFREGAYVRADQKHVVDAIVQSIGAMNPNEVESELDAGVARDSRPDRAENPKGETD